ncbi:MAG: S-layer homology domain-containing protein [Lachnospiraceae bacterium]|nr:S-layer homology domain-containing protein [Lachnospiraceae bacterium]MDD3616655.1 S-layer homology domain-containing protein [Lachnospiraceae bacterium]
MKKWKSFIVFLMVLVMSTTPVLAALPFQDIKGDEWYTEPVNYVYEKGYMTGMNDKEFGPYYTLSRAQFACVLHRMDGKPEVNYKNNFPDVDASDWYAGPVAWAYDNQIISGYSNGKFGPADNITREQIAAILYRYAKYSEYPNMTYGNIEQFSDSDMVSSYFTEAVEWAVGVGIIGGKSDGTLDPRGFAGRAECAAMIQRFYVLQNSDSVVSLTSSVTEVPESEDGMDIYFYAQVSREYESVFLVDDDTGAVFCEMLDDGQYSDSGDDLQNDNIYSCKLSYSAAEMSDINFSAWATTEDSEISMSNTIQITCLNGLNDTEIENMETVDTAINEVTSSQEFEAMPLDEKIDSVGSVIEEMVNQDKIIEESVSYNQDSSLYSFEYSSNVLGGVLLEDFDELENSSTAENVQDDSEVADSEVTESIVTESEEPVVGERRETDPDGGEVGIIESSEEDGDISTAAESSNVGNAIIYYAFDDTVNSSRYPNYTTMESQWENKGLNTTLDTDVTVNELKKIDNYDVCIFSMHGFYYGAKSKEQPVMCLNEAASGKKDKAYEADLEQHRIAKVNDHYWILPAFFTNAYPDKKLDGVNIFSETCLFMGQGGNVDYKLANALTNAGVDVLVGFHNSVYATYSRDMMKRYVDDMLDGSTAQDALNDGIETLGETDVDWFKKHASGKCHSDAAYPILRGDGNTTLINSEILNGSFEVASTPVKWEKTGDVRVVSQLGNLLPSDGKRMALLTTGIGSAEDEYIAGTEGSVLSQRFTVPQNTTSLSLGYDVVSEEPTEYVGSSYDDKFAIRILNSDNTVEKEIALETVNTSTWYPMDGVDFEGGDNTIYHTEWKEISADISAYRGKSITIQFVVYDVGDSIYDTAAVIDNVRLS